MSNDYLWRIKMTRNGVCTKGVPFLTQRTSTLTPHSQVHGLRILKYQWCSKLGWGCKDSLLSTCWCWLRMVMRLTWTGIGTMIFGLFAFSPIVERPCTIPAFTRFHFARRFWNQILTWTSLSFSWWAICDLSVSDKYFLLWNSFSSSSNCSLVKAVRLRRVFPPGLMMSDPLRGLLDDVAGSLEGEPAPSSSAKSSISSMSLSSESTISTSLSDLSDMGEVCGSEALLEGECIELDLRRRSVPAKDKKYILG